MTNICDMLKHINIVNELGADIIKDIAHLFQLRSFTSKQPIIFCGEFTTEVYFIYQGSVRATMYTPAGGEVSYQDLVAGEMFGELAAIDKMQRMTDVISLEDTQVLIISRNDFRHLIEQHPSMAWSVLKKVAGLNRFLCDRIYEYSALDVNRRIRAELIRVANTKGISIDGAIVVENPPKHQDMANRLATHREAVTRELNRLEKENLIIKGKHKLTICNVDQLKATVWDA